MCGGGKARGYWVRAMIEKVHQAQCICNALGSSLAEQSSGVKLGSQQDWKSAIAKVLTTEMELCS